MARLCGSACHTVRDEHAVAEHGATRTADMQGKCALCLSAPSFTSQTVALEVRLAPHPRHAAPGGVHNRTGDNRLGVGL